MNESSKNWPGIFGGLRVPFDPKVILLGLVGTLIFLAGVEVFEFVLEKDNLVCGTISYVFHLCSYNFASKTPVCKPETPCCRGEMVLLIIWGMLIWSIFGGAINRLVAVRIAKDDTMEIKKAFQFFWKNKLSFFLTPFVVCLIIFFFYCCNLLAGWLSHVIPYAGPILLIPVFVLVLISTLFMILLGIGLIFGFNMISSAIGVEGSDGLEAVISVINYIYSRPWSYIMYHALIIVSIVFIVVVGNFLVNLAFSSSLVVSDVTSYCYSRDGEKIKVTQQKDDKEVSIDYWTPKAKGYEDFVKNYEVQVEKADEAKKKELLKTAPRIYKPNMEIVWDYIKGTNFVDETVSHREGRTPVAISLKNIWGLSRFWAVMAFVFNLIYSLLKLLVIGYAAAYMFSSTTTAYFLLRKEVDGIEYDEVWEEEETEEELSQSEVKKEDAKPSEQPKQPEVKKEETKPAEPPKQPEVKKEEAKPAEQPKQSEETKKPEEPPQDKK